jgi:hypothetical protein
MIKNILETNNKKNNLEQNNFTKRNPFLCEHILQQNFRALYNLSGEKIEINDFASAFTLYPNVTILSDKNRKCKLNEPNKTECKNSILSENNILKEEDKNNTCNNNIMDSVLFDELHSDNVENTNQTGNENVTNTETSIVENTILDSTLTLSTDSIEKNTTTNIGENNLKIHRKNSYLEETVIYSSNPDYKSKTKQSFKYNRNTIIYDYDSEYDLDDIDFQIRIFKKQFMSLALIQPGDKLSFDEDNNIGLYKNEYLQSIKRWYYSENHEQTRINLLCIWNDYNLFNKMVRNAMNEQHIQYVQYNQIVSNGGLHPTHEHLIENCVKLIELNKIIKNGLTILLETYNHKHIELSKLINDILYAISIHNSYLEKNYIMNFYPLYMSYKYRTV